MKFVVGLIGLFIFANLGFASGKSQAERGNRLIGAHLNLFGIEGGSVGFWLGVVMAAIVGVVIIGGIKRIGSVTEKVVPFMAAIYVGTALIIILMNVTLVPEAFGLAPELKS